ncbi:MAG: Hpt domain-containing protein [Bacteroidota bacterium]
MSERPYHPFADAPSTGNSSGKLLDIQYDQLEELTGSDPQFMVEILEMIVEQTPEVLDDMDTLMESSSFGDLSARAHKYKSTINILGGNALTEVTKELEIQAKQNPTLDNLSPLIKDFNSLCSEMLRQLRVKLQQLEEA